MAPRPSRLCTAPGADGACTEASTRCPLLAARIAISAVIASRISPIKITSGDWRSTLRRSSGNPTSAFKLICDWRRPGTAYSIGSSIVWIFRCAVVQVPQARIERRRLARPGGPADQDQPAGDIKHRGQQVELPSRHSELIERRHLRRADQQPDRHVLAVQGRDRADAQVDPPDARARCGTVRTGRLIVIVIVIVIIVASRSAETELSSSRTQRPSRGLRCSARSMPAIALM